MNVEVRKVSSKLTKSMCNQMRRAPEKALEEGEVLGFVINVVKDIYKAYLIQHGDDLYVHPSNYTRSRHDETAVFRNFGKWTQKKSFESKEKCYQWWRLNSKVCVRGDAAGQIMV